MAGQPRSFEDLRDLDDITAGVFEVYTQTGKYFWIEMNRVEKITFMPPKRPLDLLWREAQLAVKDAFDATVHVPAIYGTLTGADELSRLGRRTEWVGGDGDAIVGVGRRSYVLNGEEELDALAIEAIEFSPSL